MHHKQARTREVASSSSILDVAREPLALAVATLLGQEAGLPGRVAHQYAALLGGLHVGLVVAPDPIPNGDKDKLLLIKDVPVLRCQFQKPFRETVIVLLLLDRVVESRMPKVLLPIENQELLKLRETKATL